jgi:hypothetical protein
VNDKGDAQKLSQVEVPLIMPPALRIRETTVASTEEIHNSPSSPSAGNNDFGMPTVVGSPAMEMLSLMATVRSWRRLFSGDEEAISHWRLQALNGLLSGFGFRYVRGVVVVEGVGWSRGGV